MLNPNPAPTATRPDPKPDREPESRREHAGVEYWRVERVARYLDVTRKRVYQLVQEKKLDAIRLGPRMMRVAYPSIERYLDGLIPQNE